MSFYANFYTFSKKKNSTKKPSGDGAQFSIDILENSTVLSPTIRLHSSNPTNYNYCHISQFGRYYFVSDWSNDHNSWTAHLTADPMASHKTALLATSQYVDRAANATSNRAVVDGKYAITSETVLINQNISNQSSQGRPFMNSGGYRCIISTTTGGDNAGAHPQTINGSAYYCMSPGTAESFINYLLKDTDYMSLDGDEISDSLAKGIINPVEYIGETYILPYVPPITLGAANMFVGWWAVDINHSYDVLPRSAGFQRWKIWDSGSIVVPRHPQSDTVGSYVNSPMFSSINLFAGPWGYIAIDPLLLFKYQNMKLEVYGDFKGAVELEISFYDGELQEYKFWKKLITNVAVPIAISQLSSRAIEGLSSFASGVAQAVGSYGKGDALGTVNNAAAALMTIPGSMQPKHQGNATQPGIAILMDNWFITAEFQLVTDIAPNLKGRPVCDDMILSDIPGGGFVQVTEPVLDIACYDSEYDAIISYMQGGFFIE